MERDLEGYNDYKERPSLALGSNSAFVYDFNFNEFRERYASSED
jgi:hypothetical protein